MSLNNQNHFPFLSSRVLISSGMWWLEGGFLTQTNEQGFQLSWVWFDVGKFYIFGQFWVFFMCLFWQSELGYGSAGLQAWLNVFGRSCSWPCHSLNHILNTMWKYILVNWNTFNFLFVRFCRTLWQRELIHSWQQSSYQVEASYEATSVLSTIGPYRDDINRPAKLSDLHPSIHKFTDLQNLSF